MSAISNRQPPVRVEYDSRGKRVTKEFADANEAKKFYAAKEKAGKHPKVKAAKKAAASPAKAKPKKAAAKPAKAAKGKTAEPAKADAAEVDRFGARIGTKLAAFNACITRKPKSMAELLAEAGLEKTVYNHANRLIAEGLVAKTDKGYRLK